MRPTFSRAGAALVVFLLAGTVAKAQDQGFGAAFKLRAGYGLSASEDHLSRGMLGMGFEFGYGFSSMGRLGLELGYQYKPGNQFMTNLAAMATAPGMTVDASQSVDSRKNQVGGLTARLSYEKQLGATPYSLRVGVQVGGAKFRQEYIGDVTNGTTYEDTYNGIVTKTTQALSPFAGVAYTIDKEQAFEINVVALGYTSANYVHTAGTVVNSFGGSTAWDVVETHRRSVPHLEFCYVLRF
jgi:hypothetical protein